VVLSSVMEQLKSEGVVDPFFAIHSLRHQQPGLVTNFVSPKTKCPFSQALSCRFLLFFNYYHYFFIIKKNVKVVAFRWPGFASCERAMSHSCCT